MNSAHHQPHHDGLTTKPPVSLLKRFTVRALEPQEYPRAGQLLEREHYLGDLPRGRQLLQAVECNGQWVALLDWRPATLKLADREQWIGWTSQPRVERLALVGLNRRFLVLGKTRMPNLASRSLALALQALRVCLVALKAELYPEPSWPELQERCQHNPQIPLQALLKHRSK